MERNETQEIHVYIYYRYEDRQWLLDFNSTSTNQKFIHSRKELQIVHANIFLPYDVQYSSSTKYAIYYALLQTGPCIKVMVKKMNTFF